MRWLPSAPARKTLGPPVVFPPAASAKSAVFTSSGVAVVIEVARPLVVPVVEPVVEPDDVPRVKPAAEAASSASSPAETAAPRAIQNVRDPRIDPSSAPHAPRRAARGAQFGFPSLRSRHAVTAAPAPCACAADALRILTPSPAFPVGAHA